MADGVLRLVLDRPDQKNSLTPESIRTLIEALERAATDDGARVVSIESSGPDFCSGADVVLANARDEGGAANARVSAAFSAERRSRPTA